MELNVIAIDIAKKVFQLHWVEQDTGSIERLKLKRAQLLAWFAGRQPARVVMEACGGAHEWGRQLIKLGHDVRLLTPKMVRPFVQRNKTDAADAQALWTASRQPGVRFVALKNEAQQVVLALHRLRAQHPACLVELQKRLGHRGLVRNGHHAHPSTEHTHLVHGRRASGSAACGAKEPRRSDARASARRTVRHLAPEKTQVF